MERTVPNLYDLPEDILVTAEDGLRIITLNRPNDLNASTTEMLYTYPRLFRALAEDRDADRCGPGVQRRR
jgi:enoyl-CoA hydratase